MKYELNDLAIVVAMGFDLTPENKYVFTVQIISPQKDFIFEGSDSLKIGKRLTNDVIIYKETGNTPKIAIDNLSRKLGKKLFFGHSKYLVLGKNLANHGLTFFMDTALRGYDTRPNNIMLVTRGNAEDIINSVTTDESIPAYSIEKLLKMQNSKGYACLTSRLDFANSLTSKTSEPVIGVIDLTQDEMGTNFKMTDTAVFKKDKLVGYLNSIETRGMQFIKNEIASGTILTYAPDDSKITFEILESKSELVPKIENNELSMDINISLKSNITELGEALDPMSDYKVMDNLDKLQQEQVEKEVHLALDKAQKEFKSDIFDFGESFHKKYPKYFQNISSNWNAIYPNIKVNLNVKSGVKTPGIISKPIIR